MNGYGPDKTRVRAWSFGYLFIQLLLLSHLSFANPCSTCLTEVVGEDKITCSNGHETHRECLQDEVAQAEVVTRIKEKGLQCNGLDPKGCRCTKSFSLEQVRKAMSAVNVAELDQRLAKALAPVERVVTVANANQSSAEQEVSKLSKGIEQAFDLCCPKCKQALGPLEGCEAATCSNDNCKKTFCYLCLQKQTNSLAAHDHVLRHSGDYWERRPGMKDRYHWLVARKKMDKLFKEPYLFLFKKTVAPNPVNFSAALSSKEKFLKERDMWPFPAGKNTAQWLEEVQAQSDQKIASLQQEPDLEKKSQSLKKEKEKRIELLQNEAIYQRQVKNEKSAELVDAEIKRLNGVVLASLDINKGEHKAGNIIPVMDNDPRLANIPRFRDLGRGGRTYQVGNLIWSGVAPQKMNQAAAVKFCADLGGDSRLPNKEEVEELSRAMGYPGAYNATRLPDTSGKWLWSSSVHPDNADNYYYFDGGYGDVDYGIHHLTDGSVRCVLGGID
jgi:hypothetical protein